MNAARVRRRLLPTSGAQAVVSHAEPTAVQKPMSLSLPATLPPLGDVPAIRFGALVAPTTPVVLATVMLHAAPPTEAGSGASTHTVTLPCTRNSFTACTQWT